MNTLAKSESLPSVTAAGVVAIIFGVFGALGSLLAALSTMLMPEVQTVQGVPPMPPEVRTMSAIMMFFMLALSVFGIFVGIGIIRRRNWARITILVWAGFMTFVSLSAVALSFVIFNAMPAMQLPNVNAADTGRFMHVVNLFVAIFYGIPAAVGIWWIALFTRKRVAIAFTNPVLAAPAMDPSGFPQMADPMAVQQQKRPACPLPLAILAGLFIFSGSFTLIFTLVQLPYSFPFYFFGHIYSGRGARIVMALFSLFFVIAGIGMLKLKPWALHAVLAVQSLFFINGLFAIMSPTFRADIQDAIEKSSQLYSAFPGGSPFLSINLIRPMMIFGLVFGGFIIGLLVLLRSRFLEQAAAAAIKA
jgi:hypothetical protein